MRDYHVSFARQPFAAITLNARFQLAMTGTPVENRLQDSWLVCDVIHPGLIGSSKSFVAGYSASDPERCANWIRRSPSRRAGPAAQAISDRDRLKALEREVKELRRANEILRKASAYFAQAELDRHGKW